MTFLFHCIMAYNSHHYTFMDGTTILSDSFVQFGVACIANSGDPSSAFAFHWNPCFPHLAVQTAFKGLFHEYIHIYMHYRDWLQYQSFTSLLIL